MRIAPSRPRRPMTAMTVTVLMVLVTHAPAQQTQDLLIRTGLVVTADGRTQSDLRIRNGTIVEIGSNLPAQRDAQVAADVAMLADQKVTLKIFMVRPIFDQMPPLITISSGLLARPAF
jgi:hypothetical protein